MINTIFRNILPRSNIYIIYNIKSSDLNEWQEKNPILQMNYIYVENILADATPESDLFLNNKIGIFILTISSEDFTLLFPPY